MKFLFYLIMFTLCLFILSLMYLDKEGFLIGQKLRNLGLEPFCFLNLSIYPNLIKEFLSIDVHHKSGFKGNIRGTEVVITSTSISDIFYRTRFHIIPRNFIFQRISKRYKQQKLQTKKFI